MQATVNRGSESIGSGLVANDRVAFCGVDTTVDELSTIEKALRLDTAGVSPL